MYQRIISQKISAQINKGKVIIIYGARRVGKTTLSKEILKSSIKSN
jgi:predicted AAA+ superfamily ATPase